MNPPPPAEAGEDAEPVARVITVPVATLDDAVAEFELPDAEAVVKLRIGVWDVEEDQVAELVDGVTVSKTHVVFAPV
jgi:hypothetical protein